MILSADYLLTGDKTTIIENGAVAFEGKKIKKVGSLEELKKEFPEDEVKKFPGMTLMPGMIDLHNHIQYTYGLPEEPYFNAYPQLKSFFAAKRMEDTLKAGVTTIRDVASPDKIAVALTQAGKLGYLKVPRIFTSLKGIIMTGGHGWTLTGAVQECDGEWEVRKQVRANVRDGANVIKILTSEGYRGLEMNQDEINAAVDEAHRLNVRVAAHTGYDPSLQMCIDAGVDTIEHGTHLTKEQVLQMIKKDITWVPTIFVFQNSADEVADMKVEDEFLMANIGYIKEACDLYRENLRPLYDLGVRVAVGTDTDCTGYKEAAPVYKECELFVKYGLTEMETIECATKNGAEALGMGDKIGQLKEGYSADIIAVQGKPFEDITALKNVNTVYLEGRQMV